MCACRPDLKPQQCEYSRIHYSVKLQTSAKACKPVAVKIGMDALKVSVQSPQCKASVSVDMYLKHRHKVAFILLKPAQSANACAWTVAMYEWCLPKHGKEGFQEGTQWCKFILSGDLHSRRYIPQHRSAGHAKSCMTGTQFCKCVFDYYFAQ